MSKNKTGGPAFPEKKLEQIPTHIVRGEVKEFREEFRHYSGMTLLDYFASKAMVGIFSNESQYKAVQNVMRATDKATNECLAGYAYNIAEAMIAEKQRRENETK